MARFDVFRFPALMLLACAAVWAGNVAADDEPATPAPSAAPTIEQLYDMLDGGDTAGFVEHARRRIDTQFEGPETPRLLIDLLAAALHEKNDAVAADAKACMVYFHPDSYLAPLVLQTFPNENAYRDFLKVRIDDLPADLEAPYARRHCAAVRLGLRQRDCLTGGSFLLRTCLLAQLAGDYHLAALCRERLELETDNDIRGTAEIVFDDRLGGVERVTKLHALDSSDARWCMRYFRLRLNDDEQAEPAIRGIAAEELLNSRKFAEALPLIDGLLVGDNDPRLLFWRVWCLAATDQVAQAHATHATLLEAHPDSPWTATAGELLAACQHRQKVAPQYARALAKAIADWKQGVDSFEMTIDYRPEDGREFVVYVGFDTRRQLLELSLAEGGQTVLAYRTTRDASAYLMAGEPAVHRVRRPGFVPVPRLNIDRNQQGSFEFQFGLDLKASASFDLLRQAQQRTLDSPLLSSEAGIQSILDRQLARGGYMLAPLDDDRGATRYAWKTPLGKEPGCDTMSFIVAPDGRLTSLSTERVTCHGLRYGASGSFELSPPAWPDLPVVEHDQMDASIGMRMLTAAVSLFTPRQDNPPAVAEQPDADSSR
jgi:hypothetical protein